MFVIIIKNHVLNKMILFFFIFLIELHVAFYTQWQKPTYKYLYMNNYEDKYIDYLIEYNKLESNPQENVFSSFLFQINKKSVYNQKKYDIFKKNYEYIQEKNKELIEQNNTFLLGTNAFFDEIPFENISTNVMKDIIISNFSFENKYEKFVKEPFRLLNQIFQVKKEFNWNTSGYLSPVKQQGNCGSCWAFSSTNALETFMRFKGYSIQRLSEQELVDCSTENNGCNGGFMHKAFNYIIDNEGLSSNQDYPYVAKTHQCQKGNCMIDNENISDCIPLLQNVNGSALTQYEFNVPRSIIDRVLSLQISPICIALDASSIYFQFYKSGVIDVQINKTQHLNHAVLLVGYGFDEGGLYWIIQNSWGVQWGDNGFCKIRVKDGDGILLTNLYGVYPSKIKE